jgi:hypothetical protein
MQSQKDTLERLADRLGIDRNGPEFARVWAHLEAEAWTPDEAVVDFQGAVHAARAHLRVVRKWEGAVHSGGKRKARGYSSWREYAAALERHAADVARQDAEVLAFRSEVLNGLVVNAKHADVQLWLRKHQQHHDRLTRSARALADAHGWSPNDALVFVLTDVTPARPPIRVQVQLQVGGTAVPRILVDAESWVPAGEVGRVFRNQRDRLLRRIPVERSRRVRALSPRAVALVAFVEATPGSWRDRLNAWNTANPTARFKDRANFRRTYETARRRLDLSPAFVGA